MVLRGGNTRHDLEKEFLRFQGPGSQDDLSLKFDWVKIHFSSFVSDAIMHSKSSTLLGLVRQSPPSLYSK